MKYTIKIDDNSRAEILIQLDEDDYKKAKKTALETLGKEIKVDGFRKGKIPEDVVIKTVGPEKYIQEVQNTALYLSYESIVEAEDMIPVEKPHVHMEGEKGNIFKIHVDVYPTVVIKNLEKLKMVKKNEIKVEKKEIQESIDQILERSTKYKPVMRKSKKGDKIEIDFSGFDDKGDRKDELSSLNHPLIIGLNTFVPGFEDNLIDLKVGDKKEFTIKFPEDYRNAKYKGMSVRFEVTVKNVDEPIKAELNDEYAKEISEGKFKTKKEVEDFIEAEILRNKNHENDQDYKDKVLEKFLDCIVVNIPKSLLEQEYDHMKENLVEELKQRKTSVESYLKATKDTQENFEKKLKESAGKRLKLNLGIKEYAKKEDIKLTEEEVKTALSNVDRNNKKEEILSWYYYDKCVKSLCNLAEKNG